MFTEIKELIATFRGRKVESLEPKPTVWKSSLSIRTPDGLQSLTYTVSGVGVRNPGFILPWKKFWVWYFSRPQSESFVFETSSGPVMIKRTEIRGFKITTYEDKGK